jgi:hypothetical protein
MFWLFILSAVAGETSIAVPAGVDLVRLRCGTGPVEELPVVAGRVTTRVDPSRTCDVEFVQRSGSLKLWGSWTCSPGTCAEQKGPITELAPGELQITVSDAFNATALELNCRGGYRQRTPLTDYSGSFMSVPAGDDCTVSFKGGAPGQFRGIRPGAWQCDKQGTAVFCKQK